MIRLTEAISLAAVVVFGIVTPDFRTGAAESGAFTPDSEDDSYDPYRHNYSDFNNDGLYEFGFRYYDFDKDGFYDAFTSYTDNDRDGSYDDFEYYSFSDAGTQQQKQQATQARTTSSKSATVSGQVQDVRLVNVRGQTQHLVASIQPPEGGQSTLADLGRASDLNSLNLNKGDTITVTGPRTQLGNQNVILAQSLRSNGQSKQINRDPKSYTGRVVDTRVTTIRGQKHQLAIVQLSADAQSSKAAVDLGPADRLTVNIKEGSSLTFSGFPVKVKNRPVMIAKSIRHNGQVVQINRQPPAAGGSDSPGGTQQGGQSRSQSESPTQSQGTNSSDSVGGRQR